MSDAAAAASAASTEAEKAERTRAGWPATAVGGALLLWKEGGGLMKVTFPACFIHSREETTPLEVVHFESNRFSKNAPMSRASAVLKRLLVESLLRLNLPGRLCLRV